MSYCRFSSDNFKSDVYVYADIAGGWTTHVAHSRLTKPWNGSCDDALLELRFKPIGLPMDGQMFNDPTPSACADRLRELRQMGYHVPQFAIDHLMQDASEFREDQQ